MGETKIILISRRWHQVLLQKFQESLGLAPRKAGQKLFGACGVFKEKQDHKKF